MLLHGWHGFFKMCVAQPLQRVFLFRGRCEGLGFIAQRMAALKYPSRDGYAGAFL